MQYSNNEYDKITTLALSILNSRLILKSISKETHRFLTENYLNEKGIKGWAPFLKKALNSQELVINPNKKVVYLSNKKHISLKNLEIRLENIEPFYKENNTILK